MSDEECIHLNDPALCTICNGKDAAGKPKSRPVIPKQHAVPKRSVVSKPKTPEPPASD